MTARLQDLEGALSAPGAVIFEFQLSAGAADTALDRVSIPIVSVRHGCGPVALVIGGCHGDEYEGQAIVSALIEELASAKLQGQVILLPAANSPAAAAGSRVSPLDGGNLNTAFVATRDDSPTTQIARLIEALLPRASLLLDLHSGGAPIEYTPAAMLLRQPDPSADTAVAELACSTALPHAFWVHSRDDRDNSLLAAARRAAVPAIALEIGGGGTLDLRNTRATMRAVRSALSHRGILRDCTPPEKAPMTFWDRPAVSESVFAQNGGLFEPAVEAGAMVAAGQIAGWVHCIERPWSTPAEVIFGYAGVVLCRRVTTRVAGDDWLFKVGVPAAPRPGASEQGVNRP